MLKPNAAAALAEAVKARLPPQLLESINGQGGAAWTGAAAQQGGAAAGPAVAAAAAPAPQPAAADMRSSVKAIDELKDEVRELTKIVLRQQVALEDVQQRLDREVKTRR